MNERGHEMIRKILVGTDTSASADLAVNTAADLARTNGAELTVLYVRPPEAAREVFDPKRSADPEAYLGKMVARFPDLRVRTRAEGGEPADRICAVAAEDTGPVWPVKGEPTGVPVAAVASALVAAVMAATIASARVSRRGELTSR